MANRYWVGGTAAWDGTAGSKWALTSGGAGGQAVPTTADDVFFDAASGAVTCTISTGNTGAKSIDCTGFTGTLTGTSNITVAGSITLVAGMTFTHTGNFTFTGTGTLISAGKTLGQTTINGAGITVTLGDALTLASASSFTVTAGTFLTNNFNITVASFNSNSTNIRAINLGSSTVTSGGGLDFTTTTNLTFTAGTSQINLTATSFTVNFGSGLTFNNIAFTSTAASTFVINGTATINNLSFAAPASAGVRLVTFSSPQTINGTFSTTGTAGNRRVWFQGATYGIAQTLTINSAPSLTDADFRDIYVIGTSAPISGTRIGNLRGCSGITFNAAKTVYWNLAGAQNWSATGWATTSTGTPSTDNFPLAQDTATFTNAGSVTGTITMDSAIPYTGTVDVSGRTSAMTLGGSTGYSFYGDWKSGTGLTISYSGTKTFSGRNTQTITNSGVLFGFGFTVDSFGGTVEFADAMNAGTATIAITNGGLNTKNYNLTAGILSSNNTNVRNITLGSSTLTLSGNNALNFTTFTNLTFNAGTSSINLTSAFSTLQLFGGVQFYNVTYTESTPKNIIFNNTSTFNNLTFTAPSSAGLMQYTFSANQTINGTLTCAGATAVRRIFVRSDTLGTTRTLTVNTLSATDCDFRDITIAGTAAGSSPTRAGDCGGNTGITFPAAKTVYWNLAGAQNWSATGWCPSSGGTPDINQFPLAQDTAVFDNTGSVTGTITIETGWNIGTFNASLRTSAMTLGGSSAPTVYGNWLFGTGVTSSNTGTIAFLGRGTSTITSNGVQFGCSLQINSINGITQLGDAISVDVSRFISLTTGTFDAVTYNVTTGQISFSGSSVRTCKMGSGTWTITGTGTCWALSSTTNLTFYKGTANIVFSDTSTTARTFAGGSLSYNKLTIGGTTGSSTTTISGANQFTELASTKTVAHTIDGTEAQTFGAWTVTGTAGNVVTLSGTATLTIAGARVSGVDYLALGTTTLSSTSPAEFYAGANSTGGTRFILTAAPAAVTRYWRGGTGTWDATTTTNWSATSGGAGGASVPTSADAVIFDSASNATAYTVTCTATQLRCGALTMAGPLSGNVTWAGSAPLAIHSNVSLAATGITLSYSGDITLTGSTTGRTFTTNGNTLGSSTFFYVNGVGSGWSLGSALNASSVSAGMYLINGSFDTAGYALSLSQIYTPYTNTRSLTFGASTVTLSSASGLTASTDTNLTINAGTSTILMTSGGQIYTVSPTTFYNVTWTNTSTQGNIYGTNTFNNVTFSGRTSAGLNNFYIRNGTQTINGTLSITAGTDATMRTFIQSDVVGSSRSFVVNAFSGTDADFRDITVTGAAAPISGTRLGDCKGNSGITFGAGVTRYWNLAAGGNWSATGWAATSGGSPSVNNFPLAQDTALFEATGLNSGATITINAAYNIGTINMSARTSNTMTLSTSGCNIYGNWINGTGTAFSGSGRITFVGRISQTLTSAGKTFPYQFTFDCVTGSLSLQDAFSSNANASSTFQITSGTFNANGYSVTLSGATDAVGSGSPSTTKTIAIGSGTWTIAGSGTAWSFAGQIVLPTITGTGTISLTSASAKTFAGGGISYSGITINQGGAGTLTISGDNTFANITNSYSATGATTINLGVNFQTVGAFTATGTVGKVLTIQGTSASSPATLVYTGASTIKNSDYLTITGIRAYSLATTWYAGANSTNNGSLGWIFAAGAVVTAYMGNFFAFF